MGAFSQTILNTPLPLSIYCVSRSLLPGHIVISFLADKKTLICIFVNIRLVLFLAHLSVVFIINILILSAYH